MVANVAVRSRVETITPADASRLVERFHARSKIDERLLQAYARDMQAGRWALNGAPLVLSPDGWVLDGRARLLACIQAGVPFETLVVDGIPPEAFETMDAVRKRTLADVLSIRRERHGRPLAAALRIIWTLLDGTAPGSVRAPSPISLLNLLEEQPEIRDSVMPALAAMPLLPHGCGIALHHLASRVDPMLADRFITLIGEPLSEDESSPVSQLRQVLADLKGRGGTRKQSYMLAVAIKAWNAFVSDRPVKLLRFSPEREAFPKIAGLPSTNRPCEAPDRSNVMPFPPKVIRRATVSARVVMVTPEMADQFLAGNQMNRHVSASVIHKYARDMLAGRWRLNGQTIKLSDSGQLLDGQHRLEAAKKAKVSFPAIIVEGLAEETFSSLDIGRRRALSEVLRERGESNTVVLASSLRWLWMVRNEVVLAANSSPTNGELLQLLEENPGIRNSLKHVVQIRELMGSGIACALHYTFSGRDAQRADEFFSRLIDGVHLSENSPIYQLRERLLRTRASHRVRLAEAERVALTIKAWNAFRENRSMQLLVWRHRGATREALPTAL